MVFVAQLNGKKSIAAELGNNMTMWHRRILLDRRKQIG
jgi:hypothetical protein